MLQTVFEKMTSVGGIQRSALLRVSSSHS